MTFELLSEDDQKAINADLPNVNDVCDRCCDPFRAADFLRLVSKYGEPKYPESLIVSNACFFDAATSLRNARYALEQAIAVRKYFLDRSIRKDDINAMQADIRSRFYADYVPLLVYAATEHICSGIQSLFELPKIEKGSSLKRTLKALKAKLPEDVITKTLEDFSASSYQEKTTVYRDNWVHNKPPRVESLFYSPPRTDQQRGNFKFTMTNSGANISLPPDHLWKDLIDLLKNSVRELTELLTVCADEWDKQSI